MAFVMEGNPDVPVEVFLVDHPTALQLDLHDVAGFLIVEDEIDTAVIDGQEGVIALRGPAICIGSLNPPSTIRIR